jgi:hypothetical protein
MGWPAGGFLLSVCALLLPVPDSSTQMVNKPEVTTKPTVVPNTTNHLHCIKDLRSALNT